MIRTLIIGYCMGIRSERLLCDEVHLNLAYRWFCRLGLEGDVPDHLTFSKNRHGRFRDCDLLRALFETTVARCMAEGLVGGEGFAVDASLIRADVSRQHTVDRHDDLLPGSGSHAVREYLAVLDDAAFGTATPVTPKQLAVADPAARWTARRASGRSLPTRQTPDRSRPCRDRRCGGNLGDPPGRGHCRAPNDRAHARALRPVA
ncbi:IS5 family transposase [Sphingomonas xinjiangensis]|uniref:IS5 family transposase n=1 Tax=Sphingomonas xinjiangensis TaxID=643568 RepID=A0A840YS94_9SPHN|nr:IS5 family transposase [Sphingomonas xinjiangensis]